MEITTTKTTQEIFDKMMEIASRKYKVGRKFMAFGDVEGAEEYDNEWDAICCAIAEAFEVDIVKIVKATTRR